MNRRPMPDDMDDVPMHIGSHSPMGGHSMMGGGRPRFGGPSRQQIDATGKWLGMEAAKLVILIAIILIIFFLASKGGG